MACDPAHRGLDHAMVSILPKQPTPMEEMRVDLGNVSRRDVQPMTGMLPTVHVETKFPERKMSDVQHPTVVPPPPTHDVRVIAGVVILILVLLVAVVGLSTTAL